ncbi:hypothetical protein [Halorientalis litorea]|jgi:hypothetical protein|uniref:hypothetical protein n=1 Tax=Halorientalis litorea TaxID=2931977 RepID=UPI001FF4B987|nr:hypothetical protein [Halorientalis litorea]
MPASLRDDLNIPFVVLGSFLAALVAADYLVYPGLFTVDGRTTLVYGGLLVAFTFAYGYRPLRESQYGALAASLFVMLFAGLLHAWGLRGPFVPYGLLGVAAFAFCYELYKLGRGRAQRGQLS